MVVYGAVALLDDLLSMTIRLFEFSTPSVFHGIVGAIIVIVIGIILIMIYTGKVSIKDKLALGIVVLILGILGSGGLAGLLVIIGGILIIIDALT